MRISPRRAAVLAAIVVLVAVLDWASLYLTQHDTHVGTLWPAKGLLLAVCLTFGRRNFAWAIAAGFIGSILGKLGAHDALLIAASSSAISIGSIALTTELTWRFTADEADLRDWKQLARFLGTACGVTLITGFPGAAFSVLARGGDLVTGWVNWSISTGLSYAMLTPPLVLALTRLRGEQLFAEKKRKIAAGTAGVAIVTMLVFSQTFAPVTYLVPIALMIVSLVAEIEGVAWSLLAVAAVSLPLTVAGFGPTALTAAPVASRVLLVQLFLAAMTMGMLPAAAAITERRKLRDQLRGYLGQFENASRALRENEERFRRLAEGASDIVMHSDTNGHVVYISPSVERIAGYTPDEIVGRQPEEFVDPEFREIMHGAVQDAFTEGGSRPVEYRGKHKDGRALWFEARPTAMRDAKGRVTGMHDIVRDITERKALEQELIAAREKAEAGAKAKADFLANMSHELRTPLTSVIGFADLLQEERGLNDRARDYAERVQSGGRALLATINEILDFSKLENGPLQLAPEPTQPAAIAREVLDLLAVQAKAKKLKLNLTWSMGLDGRWISIDKQRFRQMLLNLCGNAVKFTQSGSVTVQLDYKSDASGKGVLRCEVQDTGVGIAKDKLEGLFERFAQADSSISGRFGGTGLGLAICKKIAEGMGGAVGASSDEGRGSTFWFSIPAPVHFLPPETGSEDKNAARVALVAKILIVDDNDANRALVIAALGDVADVTEATGGADAVTKAERTPFDLILMDVRMPGMDGPTALTKIREGGGANAETPIIAFTADGEREIHDALRKSGFTSSLSKPLMVEDLLNCVASYATRGTARKVA